MADVSTYLYCSFVEVFLLCSFEIMNKPEYLLTHKAIAYSTTYFNLTQIGY